MTGIYNFELSGKERLGFNTGLNARVFARGLTAQLISQPGALIYPDGRFEVWKAQGVNETPDGLMVIYGPAFPGESLLELLSDNSRPDESLNAVRLWVNAMSLIISKYGETYNLLLYPGAAGAFIVTKESKSYPLGTLLFPPERLVKRCLEAGFSNGKDASVFTVAKAKQWYHPDLSGSANAESSAAFSAAVMLYAVFCGFSPFAVAVTATAKGGGANEGQSEQEILRRNIREGVFIPPELAAPGLDKSLAELIGSVLGGFKKKNNHNTEQYFDKIITFTNSIGLRKKSSWFTNLDDEEIQKHSSARERYEKSMQLKVKSRRTVQHNMPLIVLCGVAFIVVLLGIFGYSKHQARKPNTMGMSPTEVVEAYYESFGTLNHIQMSACVINKAGSDDIGVVTRLFAFTRQGSAYSVPHRMISAEEWLDAGSPETYFNVFGVTDLTTEIIEDSQMQDEIHINASYILWLPKILFDGEAGDPTLLQLPVPFRIQDYLVLVMHKDSWRISEIVRTRPLDLKK